LFYAVAGFLLSLGLPAIQGNMSSGLLSIAWAFPFFFGAVLGCVLLDGIGRKFPMIVGLAIIGVSLAMLVIVGTQLSFISIVHFAIGFAIVSTSSFIVWADLAPARARAVHYGVGFSLMAIALIVGLIGIDMVLGSVNPSQISMYLLVCSGAIFLCIPPLLQVEDALPKEIIEQRKMRQYLERAKRIYSKK
jgi:MFS family permease